MTLLPVVQRELRVAARRRRTYWVRIGAAASVLTLAGWVFLMMRHESPRQLSSILFVLVTATAGLYALLGGVGATSDTLSQEKREGTLGLLFLTDLKGYDIVLGKLVASSVGAFYGVLAVLPILAVPLLLGGITPEEVGRMSLVVINALFLSLSAGMFASSFNRDSRRSASLTFLLLGTLTAVLPGIAAWLAIQGKFPRLQEVLYLPSVGYAYVMAFDRFAAAPSSRFWQSMGVIHAFGWGFLLFASLIAPHSWQDRPAGRSRFPLREAWRKLSYGGADSRAVFRRRLLDVNPFYWLTARTRMRPAMVWIALAALAGLWFWGLIELKHDWFNEGIYVTTALVLNVLLKVWLGSEACRQLAEERQQGTLELLLSTPLSVRGILEGQRLALLRQFLKPLLLVLLIEIVFMTAGRPEFHADEERNAWTMTWAAGMVMLVCDLVALYWVGMWQGLSARTYNRAAHGTITRILVFPWILLALVMVLLVISSIGTGVEPGWKFFLGLWLVLGIGTDIGFSLIAREKLLNQFRSMAARRFEVPVTLWQRLLGR